jgi:hypothetical protein
MRAAKNIVCCVDSQLKKVDKKKKKGEKEVDKKKKKGASLWCSARGGF